MFKEYELMATEGRWELNTIGEICTRDNIVATVHGYRDKDLLLEVQEECLANAVLLVTAPKLWYALDEIRIECQRGLDPRYPQTNDELQLRLEHIWHTAIEMLTISTNTVELP